MTNQYDLVIIGAGSGGLTAASFAARVGARVALIEKHRIGGDCTWTGCVPSKALLKAARVAHLARRANEFGLNVGPVSVDMSQVRAYVHNAIDQIYEHETPEKLIAQGIELFFGAARFLDRHTVQVGEHTLSARKVLITTGAAPIIPPIPGLADVPFLTYEQIFDLDLLPRRLIVIGAGPVGVELAQGFRRLGSQVTLVDVSLLPQEDPEATAVLGRIFAEEGIHFVRGLATAVLREDESIVLTVQEQDVRGDVLLVATGRQPNVCHLNLEVAGIEYSPEGIPIDKYARTNVRHIYAAGDCAGSLQFTHLAGWQAFQAARNALFPGHSKGVTNLVPRVIFTDPEVAHVGLSEAEARQKWGDKIKITRWPMARTDRAICENDREGFVKIIHRLDGSLLGATIVAARAGEVIAEFVLALQHNLSLRDLAGTIHPYPTYATPVMQMTADVALTDFLSSTTGKIMQRLAGRP